MTPDPHPPIYPDHPQTPDGEWVHDPGCFWCEEFAAEPAATGTAKAAGS